MDSDLHAGKQNGCLFQILDYHQFYLALDNEFLADRIKSLVGFLGANWRILGRPVLTMIITNSMLGRSTKKS